VYDVGVLKRRWQIALAWLGGAVACVLACGVHAIASRRDITTTRARTAALGARLPMSDLALSGGARWLRAPGLEDPYAAFADGPGAHDPDPAGAAIAPPAEVYFPGKGAP